MNGIADDPASGGMDDPDLIGETLDTMCTNAAFRYVASSSDRRGQAEMMDVLCNANSLEGIFNDLRNKANLHSQKTELGIEASDARGSQMLNNILLALTSEQRIRGVPDTGILGDQFL